jgi:hypothetical protein
VERILRVGAGSGEAGGAVVTSGLVQHVFVKDRDNGKLRELVRQVVRRKQSAQRSTFPQLLKNQEN